MNEKRFGKNPNDTFERVWDGKVGIDAISVQNQKFYLGKFILIFSLMVGIYLPLFSVLALRINMMLITNMALISSIHLNLQSNVPIGKYSAPPEDVLYLNMLYHYGKEVTNEKFGNINTTNSRLIEILQDGSYEEWELKCPICSTQIQHADVTNLSQCGNCQRFYHRSHLIIYMKNQLEKKKSPNCPVCDTDLQVHMIDIKV